jgi:hypothetical protein
VSSQISILGLIIGIIIAVFHLLGKQAVLKHPLHKEVVKLRQQVEGTKENVTRYAVFSWGFFFSIPFIASRISSVVNGVSSSVFIGSLIFALNNLWRSLSDSSLSAGVKDYHVECRFCHVLCNCSVCFLSVERVLYFLILPVASL